MKSDKKSIIGLICVMLCCVLVIGITIGLLSSVNNTATADSTADTTDTVDSTKDTTEEPRIIEAEPELEWGYKFKKETDISSCNNKICYSAYKIQKRTNNVNEVKLTVSFGAWGGNRLIDSCNVPEYSIYFVNPEDPIEDNTLDNSIYTVKTVKEQIFSEKYNVTMDDDKDELYYYYEFNHTEEITIPKELFTESEGTVSLVIGGANVSEDPHYLKYMFLGRIDLKYQMKGTDEVVLSHTWEY